MTRVSTGPAILDSIYKQNNLKTLDKSTNGTRHFRFYLQKMFYHTDILSCNESQCVSKFPMVYTIQYTVNVCTLYNGRTMK